MGCPLFLWDGEKKLFLGRSGRGWAEIGFFFIIFFAVLFSYFCGVISFFYTFIDHQEPYLILEKGFLTTPGMGFRPRLKDYAETSYTTLIYWKENDPSSYASIVKSMGETLNRYKDQLGLKDCSKASGGATKMHSCSYEVGEIGKECNSANAFGYLDGKPCVLIHLNKIYGWVPQPYLQSEVSSIGDEETRTAATAYYGKPDSEPAIFVHCHGKDDIDVNNLPAALTYYPGPWIPVKYFPYYNQDSYMQPIVAVKFNDIRPNVAVCVQCRAYAKNLHFTRETWEAGFHFELFYHKP